MAQIIHTAEGQVALATDAEKLLLGNLEGLERFDKEQELSYAIEAVLANTIGTKAAFSHEGRAYRITWFSHENYGLNIAR